MTCLSCSKDCLNSGNSNGKYFQLLPIEVLRAIAAFLDRETGRIDNLTTKIQESVSKLREYRTALISAAVTGKIDVRGVS
ncbi:MAG: hypothetical protein SCH70_04860 [Candidatus Methanoperedens sp.]|nr:hypothetical protein [Candidatus Methanoperedens sp.]